MTAVRPASTQAEPGAQTASRLRSPRLLVLALGLGVFFAGFDQTFVVTILPDMIADLGIPIDQFGRAAWIVNGYLLGYTIAMPLMGRLADAWGHVRLYTLSIGVFALGSILVATAPNLTVPSVAGAIQALGGGAVVPISMAIIADVLPVGRRALVVGVVAALDDASSLLGPLYAAVMAEWVGWRGLFWLSVVLQLPFLVAVRRLARDLPRVARAPVDWLGGLLLALGLGALTLGMTAGAGDQPEWRSLAAGGAVAGACTWLFVWRQLSVRVPLIHLRLLRERAAAIGLAVYAVDGAATITALVCLPLMSNVLWNGTVLDGGLDLMKLLVWMPVGGVLGGVVAQFIGYRLTAALSFGLYAVGFALMWRWPARPSEVVLWGTLLVLGLGIGLNDAPIIGCLLDLVRSAEHATIAALTQAVQTTGMIIGMALLATQGLGRFDQRAADLFQRRGLDASEAEYQVLTRQTFDEVFLVAACVCLVAAVLALGLAGGRAHVLIWNPLAGIAQRPDREK
jgi:MFS family permease